MAITTGKEFVDRIMAGMSSDINDLPQAQTAAWFNSPTGNATVFKTGEPVPFDEFSFVAGIFQDDTVIRIYAFPRKAPEPTPANWVVRRPTRYTLTRTAPTYVSEFMNLEVMADEIINEWDQLASGMSSAEVEREAIIDWLSTFGNEQLFGPRLIEEIRDEAHLETDESDDDEPDEPEETGVGAAPPPPAVTPTPEPSAPVS
jgi:hypothetical protein